jgi:uncharacterized membrane protein
MHAFLIWLHVGLMMVAFAASPLGRIGMRYLLSQTTGPQAAESILRGFAAIFTVGGILVTLGVVAGVMLAWNGGLTQRWIVASIVLITIAGVGGVGIENRWITRLRRAEGETFAAVLHDRVAFVAAWASPAIWLSILWLMIAKPI